VPTYSSHENGSREFGADWARLYASAYKIDTAQLLLGVEHEKRPKPVEKPEPVVTNPELVTQPTGRPTTTHPVGALDEARAAEMFAAAFEFLGLGSNEARVLVAAIFEYSHKPRTQTEAGQPSAQAQMLSALLRSSGSR
jgi:hypothetical protein